MRDIVENLKIELIRNSLIGFCTLFYKSFINNQRFLIWFLLNVVVALIPLLGYFLDGKPASEIFPSLLMIYVVLLASSTYRLFVLDEKERNSSAGILYAKSIVWVLTLIVLATKFPYESPFFGSLFCGSALYLIMVIISVISVILAWKVYFPFIKGDIDADEHQRNFDRAENVKRDIDKANVEPEEGW